MLTLCAPFRLHVHRVAGEPFKDEIELADSKNVFLASFVGEVETGQEEALAAAFACLPMMMAVVQAILELPPDKKGVRHVSRGLACMAASTIPQVELEWPDGYRQLPPQLEGR